MPSTKNSPPPAAEHSALSLRVGTADEKAALAKAGPATLPNDSLVASLQKSHPSDPRWTSFRNDFRYVYVTNWMFQCRGYIRLASDNFDVDLFEIELFNLVDPPPVDDSALLVNRAKLALISKIHGKKVASLAMFESLFRVYFGSDTPLSGPDVDYSDDEMVQPDNSTYPAFDDLYIDEKYDVLYTMMSEVSQYPDFRDFLDKAKLHPEEMRLNTIVAGGRGAEEYTLAFDGTALYKRVVQTPELSIPKKRKLAAADPDAHYDPEVFDASSVSFELVFKDIFGFDAFLAELKNKRDKTSKQIYSVLRTPDFVSNIYAYELRKRRFLQSRRKELEVARLFAIRKRSSRIEAKEKQRHQEEQERKARELQDLQYAASRRSSRNHTRTQAHLLTMDYTAGLTREQRLALRKDKYEPSGSVSENEVSSPAIPNNADSFAPEKEQTGEPSSPFQPLTSPASGESDSPKPEPLAHLSSETQS